MKKMRRAAAFLLAVILLVLPVQPARAAVNTGQETVTAGAAREGWVSEGGAWYYYVSGKAATGWKAITGEWYYFASSGKMLTGWQSIDGIWYYFRDSGKMQTGWAKIGSDWYFFGDSGKMRTGWQKVSGSWYYFRASGKMQTGWLELSGKWYFFGESGKMRTGWQSIDGSWYYLNASGVMLTGWEKIDNAWYYLGTSGKMAAGWTKVSGTWYYFRESGKMSTGWQKISDKWYYFEASGAMKTGWLQENGWWYLLKSDGSMAVSEAVDDYVFDAYGHWIKSVSKNAALTYDNVLALLDAYDPDGAYIIRHTSESGTLKWFQGFDTIGDGYHYMNTAVHEQCHEYTNYSPGSAHRNPYTRMYLQDSERIYVGGGKVIQVEMTDVFDTLEIVNDVPQELRGNRFDTYVNTSEKYMASRQHGIYGLFNEYTAYCWGMNAGSLLEPYGYAYELDRPEWFSDEYMSFAEFRYYMLKYLLYAEEHYPEVYEDIIENDTFREAFTKVDTKFQSVVASYRARHEITHEEWEATYQALIDEVNKKEYQDLIELLKP